MARFDRYVLSQLMVLFGFFALVLISVYWVNRAVVLFDRLIADGHSAGVFLEFTALSLPNVIRMVLPMASFASAVYVTNRLSSESELTVVQASGFSPWRLARPVLVFGLIVAVMMSVLTHFLVPKSLEQLRLREAEISGSVSARLLREGTFLHPTRGVTFYIRDITPEGELRDVFLSDRRQPGRVVTYTAENAFLLRDSVGSKLVMQSGLAQTLNVAKETLSTTNFTDLTYDISGLITADSQPRRKIQFVPTLELLTDTAAVAEAANDTIGETLEEANSRFQQPILAVVAALIGYSALMIGSYSRFGVGRQIVFAIFMLVVIKLAESAVTGPVRDNAALWPLIYLPSLIGLAISGLLLRRASGPFKPGKSLPPSMAEGAA
ncbi:LPS export ABC transporter permease LptF [Puniceibacterium sediminis]|uniref:Lipopolysaccharide export system permease protein n=1 Tax=Puniceibacterium sediminis TaxID=1608407 RepID=A0A238W752_9RHOB|nr:LPS export ABC transporter permease LptF [Puniceibacterium sediminis]SNR42023.1 lipopolysaccharide export system permease protein [Puniceibacterium sediminis]